MFVRPFETEARAVSVVIDGRPVAATEGELLAAVLLRTPPFAARTTPVSGSPRAPYCLMGVCFDCLAVVDGTASVQTCLLPVRDGMRVERQAGRREVWK
jgi:D-hydroxyproline dehydrogenase subunit gamma